nr:hypothetical protein [Tanacetum cinerariifolium]
MVAILEKSEHNVDFHHMVDFIEASPLRTVTESSLRRNIKLKDEEGISSLPDTELFKNLTLMGYNISPNQKFTFQKGQFSNQWKYLIHTIMQCLSPKSAGFNEFSSNITTALVYLATNRTYNFSKMIFDGLVKNVNNKGEGLGTPIEPHHTPSPEAQPPLHTTHSSSLLPPVTTTIPTVIPSETPPIRQYTRRAKIAQSSALLTVADEPESPLRDISQGEACPTDSGFIADQYRATIAKSSILLHDSAPRVTSPAAAEGTTVLASRVAEVPTGSGSIPTADPLLLSDLVKYQDNYAKIYKFQSQQRKPLTKKQKRDYYMAVIRSNLVWKVKDFRGMTFKEVEVKFNSVWKQMEDFIPMGLKEEAKRIKRKGLSLEQESVKKQKTLEEVTEEAKSSDEVSEKKVKEMMQLILIEEVYVEALQVKHPIIDWKYLDREDLNQLWRLVKETLSKTPPTNDKEMELWVELSRLYEPDDEDQL